MGLKKKKDKYAEEGGVKLCQSKQCILNGGILYIWLYLQWGTFNMYVVKQTATFCVIVVDTGHDQKICTLYDKPSINSLFVREHLTFQTTCFYGMHDFSTADCQIVP